MKGMLQSMAFQFTHFQEIVFVLLKA